MADHKALAWNRTISADRVEPLIITCCATDGLFGGDTSLPACPNTPDEIIASVLGVYEAGATIAHLHGVYQYDDADGSTKLAAGPWPEIVRGIRGQCDIIVQLGITLASTEARLKIINQDGAKPDMLSTTMNDNDHHWNGKNFHAHHSRPEMEEIARFCQDNGIVQEYEIFHAGGIYNLNHLISLGLAKPPYWVNMPFAANGSVWSPPSSQEYNHRVSMLPEGARYHTTVFTGAKGSADVYDQNRLLAYSIAAGGHVRVGVEDCPYIEAGVPAESNAQLVGKIADMARQISRPIATVAEARTMVLGG